jgi:membrane protein
MKLKKTWGFLRMFGWAARDFNRDKLYMFGAALSYYTVFALVPMIILIIGIIGLFFDESFVRQNLQENMEEMLGGKTTHQIFAATVESNSQSGNWISTVVGLVILIFSATGLLFSLKFSINTIWRVPQPERKLMLKNLLDRGMSFLFLLAFGFLIIASFFVEAGIAALGETIADLVPGLETSDVDLIHVLFSMVFNTLLFFLIFFFLPDAVIHWKVALLGAFITAGFFHLAQIGIGFYLNHNSMIKAWGAAGSLVVILVWVFMSSQVILYCVRLTWYIAEFFHHPIVPRKRVKRWLLTA